MSVGRLPAALPGPGMAVPGPRTYARRMELLDEVIIDASPGRVWHALGERFMRVGEWAAPITSSCPVGPDEPRPGATRSCTIAPFGPMKAGVVDERLTRFDRDAMALEYEALAGLPGFIGRAVNRWHVSPADGGGARVSIHATVTLRGPMVLLGWLIRWQLRSGGARVLEELKYFVEHGRPHPRKLAAAAASSVRARGADRSATR